MVHTKEADHDDDMNPESQTKNFRGFVMSKKLKKHGYAERLKYMLMLENGYSRE